MAMIRALAIHLSSDLQHLDMLSKVVEIIDKILYCIHEYNLSIWSLRLVFPPISEYREDLRKYLSDLSSVIDSNVLYSIGIEGSSTNLSKMLKLLNEYENLYSSARCDIDYCVNKTVGDVYIKPSKDVNINIYTRFALLFGLWIETPYFPVATSVSNLLGLSVSLRYIDLIDRALTLDDSYSLFNFIENARSRVEAISKCVNMPLLGFDLSISPWKDDSVARVIEKLINNKIGFPGTVNAIFSLNKLIENLVKKLKIRSIGFNEVMLSVAEDDILNKRVENGDIRLRDLINYSTICAAGLDMVAIPMNLDIQRIAIDMLTVYKIKKRSVAMRIIPVDLEPKSSIELKGFGTTYVAMP